VDEILSQSTAEFVMCTKFHVSKVMQHHKPCLSVVSMLLYMNVIEGKSVSPWGHWHASMLASKLALRSLFII